MYCISTDKPHVNRHTTKNIDKIPFFTEHNKEVILQNKKTFLNERFSC